MTPNELAYQCGSADAFRKFSSVNQVNATGIPAAGSLGAVPPVSPANPGMPSASVKPAAPNQALPTTPVLGTGVPATPTAANLGKTQAQSAVASVPPPAAPASPTTAKSASMFSPARPPGHAKIPRSRSTVGSNNTTETAKSVSAKPVVAVAPGTETSSTGSSTPGAAQSAAKQLGGIVPSTGETPAATLANETASNTRNQVVSVSGGGK